MTVPSDWQDSFLAILISSATAWHMGEIFTVWCSNEIDALKTSKDGNSGLDNKGWWEVQHIDEWDTPIQCLNQPCPFPEYSIGSSLSPSPPSSHPWSAFCGYWGWAILRRPARILTFLFVCWILPLSQYCSKSSCDSFKDSWRFLFPRTPIWAPVPAFSIIALSKACPVSVTGWWQTEYGGLQNDRTNSSMTEYLWLLTMMDVHSLQYQR